MKGLPNRSHAGRARATLLLAGAVAAAVLAFGAGSAAAATPIDCTTNHFAFGPAPATIPPGSYSITGVCYGPFFINTGPVTLTGAAPGAALDGQNDGTLATLQTADDVTITNLTIKNGNASINGGGITAYDGGTGTTVTLNNSVVTGNRSSGWGGGVALDGSDLIMNAGSKVTGNTAGGGGGGIEATDCSFVQVTNASITNNTANGAPGGGISMDSFGCGAADGFFTGATVSGNTAADPGSGDFGGGGVYLQTAGASGASLTAIGSTFSGNKATGRNSGFGGAIWSDAGDVYLDNSVVTGNTADFGGGIAHWGDCGLGCLVGAGMDLDGSSVHHNFATVSGGGIFNLSQETDANVELDHSTVAFNKAAAGNGGGVANLGTNGNTADLLATGSWIGGNIAGLNGGGIFNDNSGPPGTAIVTLAGTWVGQLPYTLNPNKAVHGGGIFNDGIDGPADVAVQTNSRVVHNLASFPGGGLDNVCGGTFSIAPGALVLFNFPTNILNDLTPCP